MSNFGERLRELRKSRGVTAENIAQVLGVTRRAYVHYESGKREPTIDQLCKLAQFFDVSLDFLVGLSDDPTPPRRKEP